MAMGRTDQRPPPRPLGILLLALLQIWHGLWYLLITLVFFAVSSTADEAGDGGKSGFAFLFALVYLVLGIYALWLARGYVKGFEWARKRGISVAVFAIVLVFVEVLVVKLHVFLPDSPFWTIVGNVIMIWYLRRDKTKKFFASRSGLARR